VDNDTSDVNVSEHELKVTVKALTKSVEYIHKKHIIIAFIAGFLIGICAAGTQKVSLEVWVFF
jgi:hypothetical protein